MSTEVEVLERRTCTFHPERTALYDARTKAGPWANMCQECFDTRSTGKLGTGFGQKFVYPAGGPR